MKRSSNVESVDIWPKGGKTPNAAKLVDFADKLVGDLAADPDCNTVELQKDLSKSFITKEEEPIVIVNVVTGEYPQATDEAEEILVRNAKRLGIFQRAGEITRVITLPKAVKSKGLSRPEGTLMLTPMRAPSLMEEWERLITFRKSNDDLEEPAFKRINCPSRLAAAYLDRRRWKLPVLTGIISAPLMRPDDGIILTDEGYDEATGLFLKSEGNWFSIPDRPTHDDARKALEFLKAPFAEFPFKTPADYAVAITAIVTGLERRLLSACPLFAFSAPTPRSGKSKLAEAVAIIATGKPAPASTASPDHEEFRKALTATLREGHAIVNLDNIEHALKSPDLCKILTQATYADRLLGENKTLHLPTNVLWTATGNNLIIRGDLTTRTLLCDIDPEMERPEQRTFKIPSLEDYLLEHRNELIASVLIILKAFHVADRPKQKLEVWGGFEEWSRSIREPLVWAGLPDPYETRNKVLADDPEKEVAIEVFTQLEILFGRDEFTARKAAEAANETVKGDIGLDYANPALHDALAAATRAHRDINQTKLGWFFRSWRDRFIAGKRLRRTNPSGTHGATWKVEKVAGGKG